MNTNTQKPFYKKGWFIILAILFVLGAIFGDDKKSSSSSSSSYSNSGDVSCGWCGKSFTKGTGYNTLLRQISTPDQDFSHYCSRACATSFLRNN